MKDIKLSFIVPMYNSEKYLSLCLDSLLDQDIPHDEYEIICINDGSIDSTKEICLEYVKRHSNFCYYEQDNNGVSNARNLGLSKAHGKYIWFFDSDDEVSQVCLNGLLEELRKKDLDVLEVNIFIGSQYIKKKSNQPKLKFKGARRFENCSCVTKIVKREILCVNSIKFNENLKFAEDYIWSLELLKHVKKSEFCKTALYYYRENTASVTRNANSKINVIKNSFEIFGELHNNRINLNYREINSYIRSLIWDIFMSNYSISEKLQLVEFLANRGLYPYKTSYTWDQFKLFKRLFDYTPKIFLKALVCNFLLFFFRFKIVFKSFLYIKDFIYRQDVNEVKPELDMEEIKRLYYGE